MSEFKKRASALPKPLIVKAREWYEGLGDALKSTYGEDEWLRIAIAILLAEEHGLSIRDGCSTINRLQELGQPSSPIEARLAGVLRGDFSSLEGASAWLYDSVDVLLGRQVRRWMGDEVEGGQPVPIDIWCFRDVGFVDEGMREWLVSRGGAGARELQIDELGEDQYEYAQEFYEELANTLNRGRWLGFSWKPHQASAVGRVCMQRLMGVEPLFPADCL